MTNRPPPPPRSPADLENRHPLRERLGPPPAGGGRRVPPEFPPQMRPVTARPPREPRRAPRRRRSGFARGLVNLSIGLLVLALGVTAFIAVAPPIGFIRDRVTAEVKERTGRDLVISGPTALRFFPAFGLTMSDVTLSPPPGMSGDPTVAMDNLDISLKFLPLLQQQVVVERIELKNPVFNLSIDESGRKSWEFASVASARPVRLAQAATSPETASDAAGVAAGGAGTGTDVASVLSGLSIDELKIENGVVRYSDARSGIQQEASAIDARFRLPSFAHPLEGDGELTWSGEPVSFNGTLASVKTLLEGHPAKLTFNMGGRPLTALFNGNISVKNGVGVDGTIDARTHSLNTLASWLQKPQLASSHISEVAIAGQIQASADTTMLTKATISFDDVSARGTVAVKRGTQRPHITADLQMAALDLNRYRGKDNAAVTDDAVPPPEPASARRPPTEAPADDPIGRLLQQGEARPGPRVKGFTQRKGWSAEPYDLSMLDLADIDAKLSVGTLKVRAATLQDTKLRVALKDTVMRTTFDEVKLYGGRGQGFVTLEPGENGTAKVGANFAFDDLSAQPLLKDTADIDWLAGTGKLTFAIASQGESETQIVSNLNGQAGLVVTNGAIVGVNIAGALRGLSEGRLDGLKTAPSQKTDFSEMSATFVIANGVAKNDDLRITSPLLQVSGAGTVMLPQREIDYMVRPKVVASLSGREGTAADVVNGLEIPVRIHGDWDKPKFSADVKSVLDDPKTKQAVKDIKKQYKGKSANEIVDDLLSKDENGKSKAKKLLDKFLNSDDEE